MEQKLSRKELKLLAKSQIKGNLAVLFSFYLLSMVIPVIFQLQIDFQNFSSIIEVLRDNALRLHLLQPFKFSLSLSTCLSGIIVLILCAPIQFSTCYAYLKVSDEKKVNLRMITKGFTDAWDKSIFLYILIFIFTFLWTLLLIIPGIIKIYSYRMAFFILADNPEIGAREALKKSKEMMKGHKLELFILDISFIWWYVLVSLSFGLALIYVGPYTNATVTNFYKRIKIS